MTIPATVPAEIARAAAAARGHAALRVISGTRKPPAWSGKLWAVSQGVACADAALLLLTDADIVHDPRHLATLVARLNSPRVDMVSEMVRLNCASRAERWLVPAFVYFFQMLYPFARVNDPNSTLAAAAGGTVLIRREALERIGGIESIKGALIDDVTLAKAVKRGGSIYLGHSGLAVSVRRYPRVADLWDMITRTAFTQLRYSVPLLALTLIGLALVWWVPLAAALFGGGWPRAGGLAAFTLGALSFVPTLRRYPAQSLKVPRAAADRAVLTWRRRWVPPSIIGAAAALDGKTATTGARGSRLLRLIWRDTRPIAWRGPPMLDSEAMYSGKFKHLSVPRGAQRLGLLALLLRPLGATHSR